MLGDILAPASVAAAMNSHSIVVVRKIIMARELKDG